MKDHTATGTCCQCDRKFACTPAQVGRQESKHELLYCPECSALRVTHVQKRRVITDALIAYPNKTLAEIAKIAGVSAPMVSKIAKIIGQPTKERNKQKRVNTKICQEYRELCYSRQYLE